MINCFEFILIGTGTHSHVFKATMDSRGNAQVAVKLVDLRSRGEYIERFMPRELAIIPRLDHVNIVAAYAVIWLFLIKSYPFIFYLDPSDTRICCNCWGVCFWRRFAQLYSNKARKVFAGAGSKAYIPTIDGCNNLSWATSYCAQRYQMREHFSGLKFACQTGRFWICSWTSSRSGFKYPLRLSTLCCNWIIERSNLQRKWSWYLECRRCSLCYSYKWVFVQLCIINYLF